MNRRSFFRTSFMGLGALALRPLKSSILLPWNGLGRIATASISIYKEPWGQLTYDIPAEAMRFISDEEHLHLSPEVPAEDKRVEVSITRQELIA